MEYSATLRGALVMYGFCCTIYSSDCECSPVLNCSLVPSWKSGLQALNPFTPKSDQFQISPAASPVIIHHIVWRIQLFIALLRCKIIILPILTTSLIYCSLKGCENVLFELGSERVKAFIAKHKISDKRDSEEKRKNKRIKNSVSHGGGCLSLGHLAAQYHSDRTRANRSAGNVTPPPPPPSRPSCILSVP